jgi:hypothetical protein
MGNLGTGDLPDPDFSPAIYRKDDFLLVPTAGQAVTVEMLSSVIDSYLQVFDAATGALVAVNDDISEALSDARVTLPGTTGARFLVRASSANEGELGPFTIRAF